MGKNFHVDCFRCEVSDSDREATSQQLQKVIVKDSTIVTARLFAVNRNRTHTYTVIVIPPLHSTFWDMSPGYILLLLETNPLNNGLASAPYKEFHYSSSFCFSETGVVIPFSRSSKLKETFCFLCFAIVNTYPLLSMFITWHLLAYKWKLFIWQTPDRSRTNQNAPED